MTFASDHPSVPSISLAELRTLPPAQREVVLEGWVAWYSANRRHVSATFERILDRALLELRKDSVGITPTSDIGQRFDEWLENSGRVGEGKGPDEKPEAV